MNIENEATHNVIVDKKQKTNKKVLFIIISLLLVVLFLCVVMIFGQTQIEKELEMVEKIFSLNYREIISEYPNAEKEYPEEDISNLRIEENFAGLSGAYDVCVSDDGTVWRVIFEPEDESLADETIVEVITASLGDYIEYDSEWDYYLWQTDNLEIAYWIEDRTYIDWIGEDLDISVVDVSEYEDVDDSETQISEEDTKEKLTDTEIEELAIETLYSQLVSYENQYHNIDAESCRYSINKIERDDGNVEVYGIVYFYDEHGGVTKFGYDYQKNFTIHMTEWGSVPWCEME